MALRKTQRAPVFAASVVLGMVLTGITNAAYTIQIGAFRNPSMSFTADAARIASVYVTDRGNGIKALSVGSYGSREAAAEALSSLKDQYPGAYIATLSETALLFEGSDSAAPPPSSNIAVRQGPTSVERALLDRLSDAERSRVVYLDGVLHVKNGSEFIPLSEYGTQ